MNCPGTGTKDNLISNKTPQSQCESINVQIGPKVVAMPKAQRGHSSKALNRLAGLRSFAAEKERPGQKS